MRIVYFVADKQFAANRSASFFIPEASKLFNEVLVIDRVDISELGRPQVMKMIRRFKPEVIHLFWMRKWTNLIGALGKACPRARLLIDFRSPILASPIIQEERGRDNFETLNNLTHGFFSTTKQVVLDNLGVLPDDTIEYYVGLPKYIFDQKRPKLPANQSGRIKLVVVSTFDPKRNGEAYFLLCCF